MAPEDKTRPATAAGRGETGEDDVALFRQAMRGIKRLLPGHVTPHTPPPSAHPRQLEADDAEVMRQLLSAPDDDSIDSGDTLLYRSEGIQDGVLRKLRRGQYRIERELDLHGLNRDRARLEVARFLALCHDHDHRCVRIIHGKGNGSPNSGPVIKRALESWLRPRRDVLAYCSARAVDGGTGAIYVLLRAAGPSR
ncbi:MAG TPA: Smr/MutS family protein [Stenotrophobium sp.]|jgi:DNA-nicking Smr family endonuclease|nr:Smr/MutS family protein [Stenotrophobium sp.]